MSHLFMNGQINCTTATQLTCGTTVTGNNVGGCSNTVNGPYCSSSDNSYTGKEKIYKLTLTSTTTVFFDLTQLTGDLDMFLLRSCSINDCVASSTNIGDTISEHIAGTLSAGTYYLVLDGWGGAVSSFSLKTTCTSVDGQPNCSTAIPLTCGTSVSGNTSTGVNNVVGPYCNSYCNYLGKEKVYSINLTTSNTVTFNLTGLTGDLDMFLLSACNRNSCIATSTKGFNTPEQIVKTLTPGLYYLVIDGYAGAISPYDLSTSCVPLQGSTDCNELLQYSYTGNGSDLKFNFQFKGSTTNTSFLAWKINGTTYSNSPNVTFTFQTGGNYNVCAEYLDIPTNTIKSCCKTICLSIPTNCQNIINYTYTNGKFVLSLAGNSGNYTNIGWKNDTDGVDIDPNNMPANCRNLLITVRYFDNASQCWNMCCRTISFCAPTTCQDAIQYQYVATGNKFKFTFQNSYATSLTWKFDNDGTVLPNGEFVIPSNWVCANRTVTVTYFDTQSGCWRICCRVVNICPPISCENLILYNYVATGNKYKFSLNTSLAANATWKFDDDGTVLPNGEFVVPSNWTCKDRTVTVNFFDTQVQSWKTCCRKIYICPPPTCENAIDYQYIASGNKYKFTLNIQGVTGVIWKFDDDGTVLINGEFILPTGWICNNRTVSANYYNPVSQCWTICTRKVYICPPVTCQDAIQFVYNATGNKYQFTLANGNASSLIWKFEEDGTVLPNGEFVVPSGWQCKDRTVSVSYYDASIQCWRVCTKKVVICPPVNCQDIIQYQYVTVGNKYKFTLNVQNVTNAVWRFDDDNTPLPNGEFIIPTNWACKDRTITVTFYDPILQAMNMCCRKVYICPPVNCQDAITSQYIQVGNKFKFTLNAPGAMNITWKFDDDGSSIPNGEFVIPSNWTCTDRVVSVYYLDTYSMSWKVCCKKINLCPPTNCEDVVLYNYEEVGNRYKFTLNVNGATSISWRFDDDGTTIPNGIFAIPANWTCKDRTVTVTYFDPSTSCWKTCCRKIYICPPTNCQSVIQYAYNAGGNSVTFTFNGNSQLVSNISWYVEETGQQLGTGWSSTPLIIPNPCGNRTISVKYFEGGTWKICCKKITLCNPNDCSSNILHDINNGILGLKIDTSFHDITWYVDTTLVGTSNSVSYNLNGVTGSLTVTVIYKDPATGCFKTCTKVISIVNCIQPTSNFDFVVAGNLVTFTNKSTDATSYSWSLPGGTTTNGTTSTSKNPEVVFTSGKYNICLTATNTCGSKTFCKEITVSTGNECTFDMDDDVCGTKGQDVLVPVKVERFKDVLTFNFTIRLADTTKAEIVGLDQFNSTIQSGSYHFESKDHVRFFWSDPVGKSLADNTTIFGVKVRLKETSSTPISVDFSNTPVKIEGFDKDLKALPILTKSGSVCINSTVAVNGIINTTESVPVGNTVVDITGTNNVQKMTGTDGLYDMSNLQSGGNYLLRPHKNIEPLNGVNALDIVRLQRHLLFLDLLNTPYKLIAADVNNDKTINALDIVILQRLQLRLIDSFPNNESWRFVPQAYNFTTSNPLTENFPETITYNPINSNMSNQNFFGIKIGDLNGSANPSDLTGNFGDVRGGGDTVKLKIKSNYSLPGNIVSIPVTVENFNAIVALQSSFKWNAKELEFVSITNFNLANLSISNFGTQSAANGVITFTWFDGTTQGITKNDGAVLFNFNFKALNGIGTSSLLEAVNQPLELLAADPSLTQLPIAGKGGYVSVIEALSYNEQKTNVKCFGGFDGNIQLDVNGGTGSFDYLWNNGEKSPTLTELSVGTYICTITDPLSGFQLVSAPIDIISPVKLESSLFKSADNTGKITLEAVVNGGTAPYFFNWSNGMNTQKIDILSDGNFSLTVTDNNGCIVRNNMSITTGNEEVNIGNIRIYPNPTNGILHIDMHQSTSDCEYQWSLLNMVGQTITNGKISDCQQFTIDIGQQSEGMYQLKLFGDGKVSSFPIVITNK